MPRNRKSLLSDQTKLRLSQLQGAGDRVRPGDFSNLTSREAGSLVKYAIITAEKALAGQPATPEPPPGTQTPTI